MASKFNSGDFGGFGDYEFKVNISVRQFTDSYSSRRLADVTLDETITLSTEGDVESETNRVISEARDKVLRAMDIRADAKRQLLALESGDTTVEADLAS